MRFLEDDFSLSQKGNDLKREDIFSFFNDGYMRWRVSPTSFLSQNLSVAEQICTHKESGRAYLASLAMESLFRAFCGKGVGGLRSTSSQTSEFLGQGRKNERTQSLAKALTADHLKTVRALDTMFSKEVHQLFLLNAPEKAAQEDVVVLLKGLQGNTSSPFVPKGKIGHYPAEILGLIKTTHFLLKRKGRVFVPELLKEVCALPSILERTIFFQRQVYDQGISEPMIQASAKTLVRSSQALQMRRAKGLEA